MTNNGLKFTKNYCKMPIKRYKGQPLPIVVRFSSNPLLAYGKDYDSLNDVAMNLKVNVATDTDGQYLQKLQSQGGVDVDSTIHEFKMLINPVDYTNLTIGQTYFLTLAVSLNGISELVELDLADNAVKIVQDTNRA